MMKGPIIKAEDVVKTFGKIKAVDGISFEVKPGEIFAFLGPNGAGKSTTISMLTTMLRPTSGKLYMNGHDVTRDYFVASNPSEALLWIYQERSGEARWFLHGFFA